MHIDIEVKR